MRPLAGFLAVSLATWATTAGAFWDAAAASRFFDAEARAAYERADYGLALDYFLLAHAAAPEPSSAFNVATVAEVAGRRSLAFAFLRTYLVGAEPTDPNRAAATEADARLAAQLALVEVVTDPPGATLFVDHLEHGSFGVSPQVIAVEPGRHRVLASLDGYELGSVEVHAVVGARQQLAVSLRGLRAAVRVVGAPAGAEVWVRRDGEVLARFDAGQPASVPAGTIELEVRHAAYAPWTRTLRVAASSVRDVRVDLVALPVPTGTLLVSSGDVPARVRIDGVDRTETPATLSRIPIGTHRVEVHAAGFATVVREIDIRADASTLVEIALTPEEARP